MENLHSYEVPFSYIEQGVQKDELVKVRVCIVCARKLFYEKLKVMKKEQKRKRRSSVEKEEEKEEEERWESEGRLGTHEEILNVLLKTEIKQEK